MVDRIYEKNDLIQNRYVVQQILGAGNFSYVYKVLDTLSGEVVALKVFKEGTGVLEQLRGEFHILKPLSHPHIARVYDIGQLPDQAYFLKLEYIDGTTLASLIHEKRISLSKAREILVDLLDAVEYLHAAHVMHRDIKPNNIITNGRGTVIVDFNVSKRVESYASSRVGTPRYMPPEVHVAGWNWTGDLYAIGLILHEMATGRYPFEDAQPPATVEPTDPRQFNPALSESLAAFILKSIARVPADRFQTAQAMRAALELTSWDPVWHPFQISPLDLSQVGLEAKEADKPNYNPFLARLLTLYSQSRRTNAGTRGLDAFALATYAPTRLDTALKPAILSGDFPLVIITGNAGDGKTAFVQKLETEIKDDPAKTFLEGLASKNGARFVYNGRHFLTNYDGSQDENQVSNDAVLESFFRPFGGPGPIDKTGQVRVIAINEGRLIDFIETHRNGFRYLHRQILNFFEGGQTPDPELLIVNLNLRSVIADDEHGTSIFDQMVDRLTAPALWARCQNCDIATKCYAKFNADSFNDPNYGPQIRRRLKALFQIAHFRQRLHITIRDLRSALAYILFGVDDCDGIHALVADATRQEAYLARFYFNAAFDFEQPMQTSQDRLVSLLAQIDPGRVTKPKLDARLAFTQPEELSILPPFDIRSDCDRQLLHIRYDLIQTLNQTFGAAQQDDSQNVHSAIVHCLRFYQACLRRKVYFERIDEEWSPMLPYSHFMDFLQLMQTPDPAQLDNARDSLVLAITLSEGIFNTEIGQDYLCLRTSQETRVTIKSFRRFRRDRFLCKVRDVGVLGSHIEHIPAVLILEYRPEQGKSIQLEIDLDLYEMLYHIRQGYTPSLNELRGAYVNLLIFKRQLASTPYDEILLTEDEKTFYRVHKAPEQQLVLETYQGGA